MVRNLRCWWRVSRYDWTQRDGRGAYLRNTWTSISDVGNVYEGRELTLADYHQTETAYVATATAFAKEAGVTRLQVRDLETPQDGVEAGLLLDLGGAADLLRRMLREELICKLEAPTDAFAIHVGFDLYMYIGAEKPCPRAGTFAADSGLYVDADYPSPQLPAREG